MEGVDLLKGTHSSSFFLTNFHHFEGENCITKKSCLTAFGSYSLCVCVWLCVYGMQTWGFVFV